MAEICGHYRDKTDEHGKDGMAIDLEGEQKGESKNNVAKERFYNDGALVASNAIDQIYNNAREPFVSDEREISCFGEFKKSRFGDFSVVEDHPANLQ